jgi:hypothetical protein
VISVLASSAVDCGLNPRSGHINCYRICIFCFSANHLALMSKRKDWLAHNQDNVPEWSNMSIHRLLFQ